MLPDNILPTKSLWLNPMTFTFIVQIFGILFSFDIGKNSKKMAQIDDELSQNIELTQLATMMKAYYAVPKRNLKRTQKPETPNTDNHNYNRNASVMSYRHTVIEQDEIREKHCYEWNQ